MTGRPERDIETVTIAKADVHLLHYRFKKALSWRWTPVTNTRANASHIVGG